MKDKTELKPNGLEPTRIPSHASPIKEIDQKTLYAQLNEHFEDAYVVVWLDYKVLIGQWLKQKFHFFNEELFEFKYVQRMRVFNTFREILIWRTGGEWKGRLRIDGEGDITDVVIAHQLLFGTQKGNRSNSFFTEIEEERGTKLILPLSNLKFDKEGYLNPRVFIKTHNYIKPNAIGQATYFDCRFVAFTDSVNDLSQGKV